MGMSQVDLESEVVRLRHLRRLDKQISEEAEAQVRSLQTEEETCGLQLEELHKRLRMAVGSSDVASRILDRCDLVVERLLRRK